VVPYDILLGCTGRGPGIMSYGTTTSIFHLEMCHAVPRPVQPSNMSYGTTTSVFHLAICYTVPRNTLVVVPYDIMPDEIHWSWYHMTHYQVLGTGRGTI
jgi:hypothetical protein